MHVMMELSPRRGGARSLAPTVAGACAAMALLARGTRAVRLPPCSKTLWTGSCARDAIQCALLY